MHMNDSFGCALHRYLVTTELSHCDPSKDAQEHNPSLNLVANLTHSGDKICRFKGVRSDNNVYCFTLFLT